MNKLESIIESNIDKSDLYTMRYINSLNEADANQFILTLTGKLYKHITQRITDIDFNKIPDTKGDITKIPNYKTLLECLDTISAILKENGEPDDIPQEIIKAHNYIKDRIFKFEIGYKTDDEFITMIYCLTVLSIVASTSFMISSSIEYFKDKDDNFKASVVKAGIKHSRDSLLYQSILRFNNLVESGELDKILNSIIEAKSKNFVGAISIAQTFNILLGGSIILGVFPFIKDIVYFFYYCRVKISDYFEIQSDLLELNAYKLKTKSSLNPDERKRIYEKQLKLSKSLSNLSNIIKVKVKTSDTKAVSDSKSDKTKFKVNKDSNEIEKSPLF